MKLLELATRRQLGLIDCRMFAMLMYRVWLKNSVKRDCAVMPVYFWLKFYPVTHLHDSADF